MMEPYEFTFKIGGGRKYSVRNKIDGANIIPCRFKHLNLYRAEKGFVFIYVLYDEFYEKIFYVGKTINPIERINSHWKVKNNGSGKNNTIGFLKREDIGMYMDIVDKVKISEWDFWEKYYISLYKSFGFKLTNIADGGGGILGYFKHTEEVRKIISLAGIGRKMSKEARDAISSSRKGIVFSNEHIKKLSLAHKGQVHKSVLKPVIQVDCYTGEIINEYDSIIEAERSTGIVNNSISKCCKNKIKTAGGFYWVYKSEFSTFIFKEYKRNTGISPNRKPVIMIDKDNNVVCEFDSILHASKAIGKGCNGRGSILYAIKKEKKSYGYFWKFKPQ